MESSAAHNPDASERQDSDYESDPGLPRSDLTHFIETLHMSQILKYSMTLCLPLPATRFLMKVPEKPPETSTGLITNTATCARTLEHHSIARKVSN